MQNTYQICHLASDTKQFLFYCYRAAFQDRDYSTAAQILMFEQPDLLDEPKGEKKK